jgi:outer membrane immunogenic protein
MKNLVTGSVALLAMALSGSAALAADLPLRAPAPVVVSNWTGCYFGLSIGASVGYARSEYGANTIGIAPGTRISPTQLSGMLGGAQVGCNYQVGVWVFGIEGDWSITNKDGQPKGAGTLQVTESWLATARGRIGYTATDKWLWYVTGGGAWAAIRDNCNATPAIIGSPCLQTNTVSGWTVGLGSEYMLGYGWSIKAEYLYVQFSRSTYFGPTFPVALAAIDTRVQDHIFRFGMNYKFGWWGVGKGPVVAAAISK